MKRLFIAGHRGLVGRALVRHYGKLPMWEILERTREELDLCDFAATRKFFQAERPEYVILAAAKVGGIRAAATYPVEFLWENLQIQNSVIRAAHEAGVRKLLFLGSTCIYPKAAEIPIREESLLTGPMEPTNEAYSIAKIAGLRLCQAFRRQYGSDFIVAMPANLFGPYDDFDPENSHVLPSIIRRFHDAQRQGLRHITLWGSGEPRREFLYVDDLASACAFLLDHYSDETPVNVGVGSDISIREAAEVVGEITGFCGEIHWDTSQPDGNPRRMLDLRRLHGLGWKATTPFREGVETTYRWFLEQPRQDVARAN